MDSDELNSLYNFGKVYVTSIIYKLFRYVIYQYLYKAHKSLF